MDYSEYEELAGEGELTKLHNLVQAQLVAEKKMKDAELALAQAVQEWKDLCERAVPELMDSLGVSEYRTKDGILVKVDEDIRASIPKTKTVEAYDWLRTHGQSGIIKNVVKVSFGVKEDEKAMDLVKDLQENYDNVENNLSVHASTLSAMVREKLKAGEDVPLELFGVFRQRISKIKI